MTASLSPFPIFRALDANGAPLAGGQLFSYQAGTTTPLATYTDETGGSANTNPVILDSTGSATVWLAHQAYKLVLEDENNVIQWTADNILPNGSIIYGVQTVTASTTATLSSLTTGIEVNFSGSTPTLILPDVSSPAFAPYIGVPIGLFTTGNAYTIFAHDGVTQVGEVQSGGGTLMLMAQGSANGVWELNAVSKDFRGAMVTANNQSINDSAVTPISWAAAVYDTDTIFSLGSPTRLTVPAGASKIRIGGSLYWDNGAGSFRLLNIKKGGGNFAGQPQDVKFMGGNTAFVAQHGWSLPIPVNPGDYFEVYGEQDTGGALNVVGGGTGPTWFGMEIVA